MQNTFNDMQNPTLDDHSLYIKKYLLQSQFQLRPILEDYPLQESQPKVAWVKKCPKLHAL